MSAARVSVVLPTYDRRAYLEEALASVRAQTFEDWEAVVVDDGSTDGTREWLGGLTDSRIRVLERPHTGNVSALRNAAVREAAGRWVAFLDSDDRWHPEKLERQLSALGREPACRWSYTLGRVIDAEGRPVENAWMDEAEPRGGPVLRELLLHEVRVLAPSAFVVERELMIEVGGFDERLPFCEDFDLWIRLATRSPVAAVPERLFELRRHASNNTRGQAEIERSLVAIYARRGPELEDPELRRICRAQEHVFRLRWANRLSAEGRSLASLRTLVSSLRLGAPGRLWWATFARLMFRPVTPEGLRRRLRRPLPWRP